MMLSDYQFGFWKNCSTIFAINKIYKKNLQNTFMQVLGVIVKCLAIENKLKKNKKLTYLPKLEKLTTIKSVFKKGGRKGGTGPWIPLLTAPFNK